MRDRFAFGSTGKATSATGFAEPVANPDLWHGFSNGWPAAASFFPAFVLRSKNQFMPDRRLVMPRYDMIALSEFDPFGSIQI